MARTIFYSWQADTPAALNRTFIENAIKRAITELSLEAQIEPADREEIVLDKDTIGVPGMPPIVDTILGKIDASAAFVADLTFVGSRSDGIRLTPNPNVLIEYGYALKSLTHAGIVAVMNTHYGEPSDDNLPFDMKHLRRPITYLIAEDTSPEQKKNPTHTAG
jgi:hypothetical protein